MLDVTGTELTKNMAAEPLKNLPTLDAKTGNLHVGDFVISKDSTIADVKKAGFKLSEQTHTQEFNKREIFCQWASVMVKNGVYDYEFTAGFTNSKLCRFNVTVDAPHLQAADWNEYFDKAYPEIKRLLTSWLTKQVGKLQFDSKTFDWGRAGVGQDKSENLFIVITNQHWDEEYR